MELLKDKVYNDWVKGYLYSKQNKRCIGCLDEYSKRNMEIDHIEPKSKGGTDDPSNLQLLCSTCNRMKGTSSQAVFLAKTAHLRVRKSTEGMDFDSSKLETHSEHDWSFKEVAEEILAEVGMPKKEIRKTIKRLYPHGFLPNVKLGAARGAAWEYKRKQEEKIEAKKEAAKKRAEEKKKKEREARWKAEEEAEEKRRKEIGAFGRWWEDSILIIDLIIDLIKEYKWRIAIGAFIVFIIIIAR